MKNIIIKDNTHINKVCTGLNRLAKTYYRMYFDKEQSLDANSKIETQHILKLSFEMIPELKDFQGFELNVFVNDDYEASFKLLQKEDRDNFPSISKIEKQIDLPHPIEYSDMTIELTEPEEEIVDGLDDEDGCFSTRDSKILGYPCWEQEPDYPLDDNDEPYEFLMQIVQEDFPIEFWYDGILYIFYNRENIKDIKLVWQNT